MKMCGVGLLLRNVIAVSNEDFIAGVGSKFSSPVLTSAASMTYLSPIILKSRNIHYIVASLSWRKYVEEYNEILIFKKQRNARRKSVDPHRPSDLKITILEMVPWIKLGKMGMKAETFVRQFIGLYVLRQIKCLNLNIEGRDLESIKGTKQCAAGNIYLVSSSRMGVASTKHPDWCR